MPAISAISTATSSTCSATAEASSPLKASNARRGSFRGGRRVCSPVAHRLEAGRTDSDGLLVRAVERGSAGEFAVETLERDAPVTGATEEGQGRRVTAAAK
jgi:hypothetical protein